MPHEVLSTRAVEKLEVHLLITSEYSDLKEHSLPISLLRNIGNSANCEWVKVWHVSPLALHCFNLRFLIKPHFMQHLCKRMGNRLHESDKHTVGGKIRIRVIDSDSMSHKVDFYCYPMGLSNIIREIDLAHFRPCLRIPMLPWPIDKVVYIFEVVRGRVNGACSRLFPRDSFPTWHCKRL